MTRRAMLVLACLAVALGGVIAIESKPETVREGLPPPGDIMRLGRVAAHAGDTKQVQTWVDVILARPLFSPSRRPLARAGSGNSDPGFPRLTGIIIMPHQREAIFAVPGKTKQIVVTAGSRLNGVLIKSIDAGSVVVVDAAGARRLRPSFAAAATSTAAASTPVLIDRPPMPSGPHALPFASIRGLSGRPLGLAAEPNTTPPDGGAFSIAPSRPAPAPTGGSP
jgi:general secretion pathway protein N